MNDILNMLGLASKARKLITGEEFVVEAIRNNSVHLVFLANDAGKNTSKKILNKARYYNVRVCMTYSSAELSHAIGRNNRMVIGIADQGFAISIIKKGCDCYGKKDEENGGTNK